MALKQLILRKQLGALRVQLGEFEKKEESFTERSEEMKTREAELEAAIEEMSDTATEEEKAVVDEGVEELEADQKTLTEEQEENDKSKKNLQDEIEKLQAELDDLDQRTKKPVIDPAPKASEPAVRKDDGFMINRGRFSGFETVEQRSRFVEREDVKDFLVRVRGLKSEKRGVTGAELAIPDVMLELLRDNLHKYSKLLGKVFFVPVSGTARQTIMGDIPEAVWTEAVGKLNELVLSFAQIEVDAYKVGGFIPVPNSTLEDSSDIKLFDQIMNALGQSLGLATDKAIVFGTGTKMPLGVASRLAQTSEPSDWDANGPAWTDLHSTNVLTLNPASYSTAVDFFAALMLLCAIPKVNYSSGTKFWVMNENTKVKLLTKALAFNAAGALVSAMNNTMPVIGGEIIVLPFMADNDIAGGYGSLYLLAERSGASFATSEHAMFVEDMTLFKGTARYDGKPVYGEGFMIVNINNDAPTTSVQFPQDVANTVATPVALPIAGSYTGAQEVALTCATEGATIYYTDDGSTPTASSTAYNGPIAVAATATIKAVAIKSGMTDSAVLSATYTIS